MTARCRVLSFRREEKSHDVNLIRNGSDRLTLCDSSILRNDSKFTVLSFRRQEKSHNINLRINNIYRLSLCDSSIFRNDSKIQGFVISTWGEITWCQSHKKWQWSINFMWFLNTSEWQQDSGFCHFDVRRNHMVSISL